MPTVLPSRETPDSASNARRLEKHIQNYDPLLRVRFSSVNGWYYVMRKTSCQLDEDAAAIMSGGSSESADSLKEHCFVVCTPIDVRLMREFEAVRRNVMRHLQENDTRKLTGNAATRVEKMEQHFDDPEGVARRQAFQKDERMARARELFREQVTIKAFFDQRKLEKPEAKSG